MIHPFGCRPALRNARSLLLLLSLGLLIPSLAAADDRALLIGVGEYRIEEANLPGVTEDLVMMREVARTLGFAESQIKVLSNSEATLQGIRDAISDWLVDGTTAGDRALFYHSGHGTRIPDVSDDESDGSDEALLPFDFVEIPSANGEKHLSNVLLDDELGRLLARIPAREVIALVDSCHSGTMTRSLGSEWTSKFYNYRGMPRGSLTDSTRGGRWREQRDKIVLLSAARPEEDAQTSKHGALFTQGVWRAVRAAEPQQRITLEQLQGAAELHIRQEIGTRTELIHRPMLTGGAGLRSINLFLEAAPSIASTATPRPSRPLSEAANTLWHQLEGLVRDATQSLDLFTSKSTYASGESLELSVNATGDGYLYIFNIGESEDELILLFPNRYQTDNRVHSGQTVELPFANQFTLPAHLPADRHRQKNLVVALQTSQPLLLDDTPLGDTVSTNADELFRVIRRPELTRSIARQPRSKPAYSAGQVVVTIDSGT